MSQRATVSLTRELGFAIIRRQRWLTPERSRELMKAIEGATFDNKRKLNYATIDKVPGILQRLREAEFSVECDEDLMKAISEHETRTWIDIRAAKERAMKVDEELGKITDRITGKPLHLFPFQQTGIVWLATRYGGILGDEQGLGKTLSTLAALPANSRVVVVCPAVVKGVWKREIQQKRSHLRATVLEGKRAFVGWPKPGEVWLLNPEIMPETHTKECLTKRKDKKTTLPGRHRLECEIAKRSWVIGVVPEAQPKKAIEAMACKGCLTPAIEAKRCDGCLPITENVPEDMVLVYDEAHMFKNLKAQRTIKARSLARAVRRVGGRVWLLTGTPLLNRPEEMWALSDVALVAEEAFGSYDQFVKLLGGRPADGGYGWVWEGDPETAQVAERIERIMLRRRRVDVMPELPRKTFQIVPVEVDREALAACDAALAEYGGVDRIADMLDSKIEFKSISRIREALAKAKVPAMLSLIEEYEESGEPVVVASAHRAPIDALATRPGWRVITGDINASQRTEIEDAFQRGELKGVGCTIQSAGVGITLTRACHMIRVDSAWSPGINAQMDDRICRIGQTRPVLIRILAANHPLDERVEETLARKQHLIESTIDAAAQPPPPAEGGEAEDI